MITPISIKEMKDRIYQLMKKLGLTQKEFAAKLCVAEGTLSSIFNGRTKPTNNLVNAVHTFFPDVSITWLMFGEGEMYESGPQESQKESGDEPQQVALQFPEQAPETAMAVTPMLEQLSETMKNLNKPKRKIVEIRVFFDDDTFEIFSPRQ